MPLDPLLADLVLRVVLTAIAAAAIGFERTETGKAAGLRTTLLVALAACLAMLQVNLLLPIGGKTAGSFAVMDLMRLPLGILSGVGFIGAGAILRRDNAVVGVTTAATLWYVTVLGLAFGGGQIWLGIAGSLLGLVIIHGLRRLEPRLRRERQAILTVRWDNRRLQQPTLLTMMTAASPKLTRRRTDLSNVTGFGEMEVDLRWQAAPGDDEKPVLLADSLTRQPGVLSVALSLSGDPAGGHH